MKVLVVGGGGREHALAWKLARSPRLARLYAAPGNPGIAAHAECVDLKVAAAADLVAFAERERIDLTVIGPEAPLVAGLADRFAERGLLALGPNTATPACRSSSPTPAARGASGPTTTRSTRFSRHRPSSPSVSSARIG